MGERRVGVMRSHAIGRGKKESKGKEKKGKEEVGEVVVVLWSWCCGGCGGIHSNIWD